jgi:hypothetical protein
MPTTTTTHAIAARLKAALHAFANKALRTRRAHPALLAIPALALACSLAAATAPQAAAANTSPAPGAHHAVANAATCNSSSCVGQDPRTMGCNTGRVTTLEKMPYWSTSQHKILTVYLRYSPECNSKWAKIQPAPNGYQFYVENTNGLNKQIEVVGSTFNSGWFSNMVDGKYPAHACFLNGKCTNWH